MQNTLIKRIKSKINKMIRLNDVNHKDRFAQHEFWYCRGLDSALRIIDNEENR
jgi:hypothetical protein